MESAKFASFQTLSTPYKTIDDHPIAVHTLIPKSSAQGPRPVIVKFHGGFLITGTAEYAEWFPQWLISYALEHSAIVVLPNYRLMPEATGREIMDDVHDFWRWLKNDLQAYLKKEAPGVDVDVANVLVTGESAGGYLSIQSALGSAGEGFLKAAIATYPTLDVKSRFYTEEYEKVILGAPTLPKDILAQHLSAVEEDAKSGKRRVVTSAAPPERLPFALSAIQQGRYAKLLGEERNLYPMERIEDVSAGDVPPILILHGREDSAVPVEGSEKWVEKAREKLGSEKVKFVVQPGEHGFDADEGITLETPWLKNELVRITKAWLGKE